MKLFLAGGFLGSGKTTAIQKAVQYLQQQNIKAGVVTNDQGHQQVDTQFMQASNIPAREVANSCFCCNYPALETGILELEALEEAEVVFAESVGSCTDLAATIINPLLSFNPGKYEIVLSVFADIRLLVLYLQNDKRLFFEDVKYIYQKQLEEADIIIVNKIDLITDEQLQQAKAMIEAAYPSKKILYQNSLSAESIKDWVDMMCNRFTNPQLRKALDVDYDIYGNGEAQLTWLDEEVSITTQHGDGAVKSATMVINRIGEVLNAKGYTIGHLKCMINTGAERQKISFTTLRAVERPRETIEESATATMLINARVQATPAALQGIVNDAISYVQSVTGCNITANKTSCFIPGYPKPTHRIAGEGGHRISMSQEYKSPLSR